MRSPLIANLSALMKSLNVKELATVPVRATCIKCKEAPIRHIHFPHVTHWCDECGHKVDVKLMPYGVAYVKNECRV